MLKGIEGDMVDFYLVGFVCVRFDDWVSCELDGDLILFIKGFELEFVILFFGCGICLFCWEGEFIVVKELGVLEEMELISFDICLLFNLIGDVVLFFIGIGDFVFISFWLLVFCRVDL